VFTPGPSETISTDIHTSLSQDVQDAMLVFIGPLILEVKNCLPSYSISKASLNKAPFDTMPALRHILLKYESLITDNSAPHTQPEPSHTQFETSENVAPSNRRRKKKTKRRRKQSKNEKKFVPPRLFGLFPNPGLQWRFVKVDGQNLKSIFRSITLNQEQDETLFSYTQRCFFNQFDIGKLRIKT
jgi:hypothetical protein